MPQNKKGFLRKTKVLWHNEVATRRDVNLAEENLLVNIRSELGLGIWKDKKNNFYNEEFDPGSGWTLAGGLTHASRGAAQVAILGGDRRTGE